VTTIPPSIARRFDALVFDWDGTAVTDRAADASAVREVVEALCAAGVHIAVVSGTHVGNVDGQLRARPSGPGRLFLALNRGSELFDAVIRKQAYLTMPVSRVRVTLQTEILDQFTLPDINLFRPPLFADADLHDLAHCHPPI
jgi:hydroxymethylpyrimidine pyrophosphatase-like HAD family hydrolase